MRLFISAGLGMANNTAAIGTSAVIHNVRVGAADQRQVSWRPKYCKVILWNWNIERTPVSAYPVGALYDCWCHLWHHNKYPVTLRYYSIDQDPWQELILQLAASWEGCYCHHFYAGLEPIRMSACKRNVSLSLTNLGQDISCSEIRLLTMPLPGYYRFRRVLTSFYSLQAQRACGVYQNTDQHSL